MLKQQIVIEGDMDSFKSKVNNLLFDGWQIIPGSFQVVNEVVGEQSPLLYIIFLVEMTT